MSVAGPAACCLNSASNGMDSIALASSGPGRALLGLPCEVLKMSQRMLASISEQVHGIQSLCHPLSFSAHPCLCRRRSGHLAECVHWALACLSASFPSRERFEALGHKESLQKTHHPLKGVVPCKTLPSTFYTCLPTGDRQVALAGITCVQGLPAACTEQEPQGAPRCPPRTCCFTPPPYSVRLSTTVFRWNGSWGQ